MVYFIHSQKSDSLEETNVEKSYALFDFDGTLRKGDSIITVCRYAHKKGLCSTGQLLRGAWYGVLYGLKLCSAERSKTEAMQWIKGRLRSEMDAFSIDFCLNKLIPEMFPAGLKAIQDEKARGASVLLITASPAFYLNAMESLLGVESVIGTRMNLDDQDRYTGEICGDNCKGFQKPLRLAEYLAAMGDSLVFESSAAYGDSASDLPMMQLCQSKVGVNAKRKLKKALVTEEGVSNVRWRGKNQR